jgi:hypothetical protein
MVDFFIINVVDVNQIHDLLNKTMFIYLDVSKLSGLLDEGEWDYYIERDGNSECSCKLKPICSKLKNIPNPFVFELGGHDRLNV